MESRRFRLAAVLPFSWEKADLYNGTRIHPRAPETNIAVGKALHTRASAASEWSPAGAERTVNLAMAGARRVKCELYNSRNFGNSGRGDLSSPCGTTP